MLRRLGFVGRMMAIVLLALLALGIVAIGWGYATQGPGRPHLYLPLPKQVAAIIAMLEANEPDRRVAVLDAVGSDTLSVSLVNARPMVPPDKSRLPGLEWLMARYVDALGDREVIAFFAGGADGRMGLRLGNNFLRAREPLRLAISLKTGEWAVFETRGDLTRRLFGLPPGFWMGALGSLIGISAIVAVAREARPLTELAHAVAQFGGNEAQPVRVQLKGAPEITKLVAAVNEMQARIASLLRGRTVFFGAISHDLKTYITRLRLRAELIPEEEQRDKAVRDLDEMTALIDDALAVARGSTAASRRAKVDLVTLLRAEAKDRAALLLSIHHDLGPVGVDADAIALRRLFANLLDNARRFASSCCVSIHVERACAVVYVDDDGPGIPAGERLAVFEPFYRLEPSRSRETGGSGLGLAIAREIVIAHGGTITIETSPMLGARVRVALPMSSFKDECGQTSAQLTTAS